MLTGSDLADIVWETMKGKTERRVPKLGRYPSEPFIRSFSTLAAGGRIAVTEYDIRRLYREQGKKITLPSRAVLTPLAKDFADEKGIEFQQK